MNRFQNMKLDDMSCVNGNLRDHRSVESKGKWVKMPCLETFAFLDSFFSFSKGRKKGLQKVEMNKMMHDGIFQGTAVKKKNLQIYNTRDQQGQTNCLKKERKFKH